MESTRGDTTGSRTRNPDLCPPLSTSLDEMETNENEMEDLETTKEGQSERPKKKEMSRRSVVWDHFALYSDKDGKPRAKCKYCDKNYAADPAKNGTSALNNHMKTCKNHPANKHIGDSKTITSFCQNTGIKEVSSNWKFEQEAVRKALVRMIIIDELPFKFVENEGFREFMLVSCPQFVVPSRATITRDCLKLYFEERDNLKAYFKTSGQRISLTTDTWTSNQRITYLCLTGHYVDDEWKLHKVILNFVPCPKHKGDDLGLLIEKCLLEWGIEKIFGITVDNASSNDRTVAYLRRRFINWGTAILDGKYLHMRCVAHIINLVVKDGLKELNESIERIRTVVRYVRQSPLRLKKFKDFVIEEKIESKKSLCLDVPTRWNSVYTMLDTAVVFKGVFDRYEVYDSDFRADFMPGGAHGDIGLPTKYDWIVVEKFVTVLRYFYELTFRVSGSLFVTSNTFLDEIHEVNEHLNDWLKCDDDDLVDMASRMKSKFDKYWGSIEKFNMMLYIGFMLDPRHKFGFLQYYLKNMYGSERGDQVSKLARNALYEVFAEYKKVYSSVTSSTSSPSSTSNVSQESRLSRDPTNAIDKKMRIQELITGIGVEESELDMYLNERLEKASSKLDILDWWKFESRRYPILSKLARDVLAMPLSTVASESTFSTGGRIIDDFRSSLTPKTAQALICCQDWIRHTLAKSTEEEYEFIEKIEKDLKELNVGADSNIIGI